MNDVWYCDPQKNEKCKKSGCYLYGGPCHLTTHKENAIVLRGEPMKGPDIEGEKDGTV